MSSNVPTAAKYLFTQGKRAEKELEYVVAARNYRMAYDVAVKAKLSSALVYKWAAERCDELQKIKDRLLSTVAYKEARSGLVEGSYVYAYWNFADDVVPKAILEAAKDKLPASWPWTVVKYNSTLKSCEFIRVDSFGIESEPYLGESRLVTSIGATVHYSNPDNPKVLKNKWALIPPEYATYSRTSWLRRAIKLEYLGIPSHLWSIAGRRDFFAHYVAPYIGNRCIPVKSKKELEKRFKCGT